MPPVVLPAAMPEPVVPDWTGSIWIGQIDLSASIADGVELAHATGYQRARILVRSGRAPLGFIELDVHDSKLSTSELQLAINGLPPIETAAPPDPPLLPVSVVLCTRNRPEALRTAIGSLLALNYPLLEIVIVDNASDTDASRHVVDAFCDPRVRLVVEPRPGLAKARNRGVLEATHEVVAFTDDDVVVDQDWLMGLMDGFAAHPNVGCVCGIVPSGELRSFSQGYFDSRVSWARSCRPRHYQLASPPSGQPLFPFQVGQYGTGANFAMRRSLLFELGGFDEALGVGSPTRGGEDIDIFVRTLLSGHGLMYQPSALVWHRHRADIADLHRQIVGYGLGLGAWIGKLLADPRTAPMVLRRSVRGVLHARKMTTEALESEAVPENRSRDSSQRGSKKLAAVELWAAARGPLYYYRARWGGARKAPLLAVAPVDR